jgi:hypothetical protein
MNAFLNYHSEIKFERWINECHIMGRIYISNPDGARYAGSFFPSLMATKDQQSSPKISQ